MGAPVDACELRRFFKLESEIGCVTDTLGQLLVVCARVMMCHDVSTPSSLLIISSSAPYIHPEQQILVHETFTCNQVASLKGHQGKIR